MDAATLAKLTEGQRVCLRMVLRHMSSKEIARALGISRHTVDQRLRLAMRTLQVANDRGAAMGMNVRGNDNELFARNLFHWLARGR